MARKNLEGARDPQALPLVGAQISSAGGWSQVPARALAVGAEVVQVFSSNPRIWPTTPPEVHGLTTFEAALRSLRLPLFLHAIYLINPASPDEALRDRSVAALAHALLTGALAGAAGVVTHLGSHRGEGFQAAAPLIVEVVQTAWSSAQSDLETLCRALRHSEGDALAVVPGGDCTLPPLLLETAAGAGATVGGTLAELHSLVGLFGQPSAAAAGPRVGLCLDTAHMFAAGYAIHQEAGLAAVVDELRRGDLLARVGLIHLNDSASLFASKRDRHANPGEGELGYEGLARIVSHPAFAQVPFALEVPGSEGHGPGLAELALVKTMRQGAPCPPTPLDGRESGPVAPE